MYVAIRSTWSNTVAIDVTATSTLANVKLYGASTMIGISSLLSNVAAVSVSTASLLSNVANVDSDLASALTTIPANTLTRVLEGALTVEQALRVILAWASGEVLVAGAVRTFMDLAGTKPRISGTEDANGQRTGVSVDGS
jgi:hypothetical protein